MALSRWTPPVALSLILLLSCATWASKADASLYDLASTLSSSKSGTSAEGDLKITVDSWIRNQEANNLYEIEFWTRLANEEGISLEDLLMRQFSGIPPRGFSNSNPPGQLLFLLQNNSAIQEYSVSFRTERASFDIEDYIFTWKSTNERVLNPVNVNYTVTGFSEFNGTNGETVKVYNMTFIMYFDDFVGVTDLIVDAELKPTLQGIRNYNVTENIIAGGFVLYDPVFPFDGQNAVLTGLNRDNELVGRRLGTTDTGLHNFGVYVQYLNGTTSNTTIVDFMTVQSYLNHDSPIVLYNESICDIDGGIWNSATGSMIMMSPQCGYTFNNNTNIFDVYFALQLQYEREGTLSIWFVWPEFDEILGDFENIYFVDVVNDSPLKPVLTFVDPRGPFRIFGGESISFSGYNLNLSSPSRWTFKVFTNEPWTSTTTRIDGDANFQTLTFLTQPGTGRNYDWNVSLVYNNGSSVFATKAIDPVFLFSYFQLLRLDQVIPNNTPDLQGGIQVTLKGLFEGFNPILYPLTDHVVFEGSPIDNSRILSFSNDTIVFTLPSRSTLNPPDLYTYQVQVQAGLLFSNGLPFYFTPIDVTILVRGAQETSPGSREYKYAGGVAVFDGLASGQLFGLQYEWTVFDQLGQILSIVGNMSAPTISIPYDELDVPIDVPIVIQVLVRNAFGQNATDSVSLIKLRADSPLIIVSVLPVAGRTPAFPDAPLTIVALVDVLNIDPNEEIAYIWTWDNEEYRFDSTDSAPYNESTPTRYGRIFVVPQNLLVPSDTLYTASCTAYMVSNTAVRATSSTPVQIYASDLVAVIRDGAAGTELASGSSLTMFGTNSYDPDVLDGSAQNIGFIYSWPSCEKSLSANFETVSECSIVPAGSSFTVSAQTWAEDALSTSAATYFRFTLRVLKGSRVSETVAFVVTYIPGSPIYTQLDNIMVEYADGSRVNLNEVDPLQGISVRPTGSTGFTNVRWEFLFISPPEAFDITETQVISSTGYWAPGNASAYPLLLKPGALISNSIAWETTFVLEIIFLSNAAENRAVITMRTIPQPVLEFNNLNSYVGTETTKFVASSTAFYPNVRYFCNFQYFYYATNVDTNETYCLDGCSGAAYVAFSIYESGSYRLSVELRDAKGGSLFASVVDPRLIRISVSEPVVNFGTGMLASCYIQGDHSCVEGLSYALSTTLSTSNRLLSVYREDFDDGEEDENSLLDSLLRGPQHLSLIAAMRQSNDEKTAVVASALEKLQQSANNAVVNTGLIQNYLMTIEGIAGLGRDVVNTLNMLTDALIVLNGAMFRKPSLIQIGSTASEYLVSCYTSFPDIVLKITEDTGPTTRRRLLQNDNFFNIALLNMYSSQGTQVAFSLQDNQICGFSQTVTIIPDSEEALALYGPSTVSAAVRCLPVQNTVGVTAGSNSLVACDRLFQGYRKVGLELTSTFDYAFAGGSENSNEPASNLYIPQMTLRNYAKSALPTIDQCYRVFSLLNTTEFDPQQLPGLNISVFQMTPLNDVTNPATTENSVYQRSFEGVEEGSAVIVNQSVVQEIIVDKSGLFGAQINTIPATASPAPPTTGPSSTPSPTQPSGGGLSAAAIAGIVVGIMIFIIVAVIITWLIATRCFILAAPPPLDEGFEYVERDIYGRGFIVETEGEGFMGDTEVESSSAVMSNYRSEN